MSLREHEVKALAYNFSCKQVNLSTDYDTSSIEV